MGKFLKKAEAITLVCALALGITAVAAPTAKADAIEVKPYIAFGQDLKSSEKKTVMELLDVTEDELDDYEVIEVTNDEEHEYLDDYLASSVIGTRALSSVKIEEIDAGEGIQVETKNINFCTEAMYVNALATAGFTDADVTVVGPFELSGTAALVGAIKAYSTMTGSEVDEEAADAAMDELVTTGELVDSLGADDASKLIAIIKDAVVSGDLDSDEDILAAIDKGADEMGVTLNDDERQQILELMKKIGALDLDLDALQRSAQSIYDQLDGMGIDIGSLGGSSGGFFSAIGDFFSNIGNAISSFFGGLFG